MSGCGTLLGSGTLGDRGVHLALRRPRAGAPGRRNGLMLSIHPNAPPRLRLAGLRTSRRRVLRLTREHGLLAHQRAGHPRGPKAHDGTITTERVGLMRGADLTSV